MTPEILIKRHADDLADLLYTDPATTLTGLIGQIEDAEDEWSAQSEAGPKFAAALALLREAYNTSSDHQPALLSSADQQLTGAIAAS